LSTALTGVRRLLVNHVNLIIIRDIRKLTLVELETNLIKVLYRGP
jgi:hypothetical protein